MSGKEISIPATLFERIGVRIEGTGFGSVDEYVAFVLREVLAEDEEAAKPAYSREDEERVKERLRSLGYLD